MTLAANRAARGLLSLVFVAAAVAKAYEILGHDAGRWSALRSSWSRGTMVLVDVVIVGLLLSRRWRVGSAAAVIVAAGGNVVYAAALHDGRIASACGCLGRLALTPFQHAVLSVVVFLLAGWTLAGERARAGARGEGALVQPAGARGTACR